MSYLEVESKITPTGIIPSKVSDDWVDYCTAPNKMSPSGVGRELVLAPWWVGGG